MRVLTCKSPGVFEYSEQPAPELTKGHALIQVEHVGICGTDLHAFEGTQPYFNYPRVLGHEISGRILDVDGNDEFTKGRSVTFVPYFNCGTCIACRSNKPNCCVDLKVFGVHIDGGMKDIISVPSSKLVIAGGLSLEQLAIVEPLAIGSHAVRRAEVRPNEFALVIGAGPIGLGVIKFAQLAGAHVIAMDMNKHRLEFVKSRAEYVIDGAAPDIIERLREITNGDMPTVVFDATGSQRAINDGFKYMAHGARYVLVGLQKGDVTFSHPEFHKREGTLMSSRNAAECDFYEVIDNTYKWETMNPSDYITHRMKFEEIKDMFPSLLDPKNGVIKAVVEFCK